MKIDLDRKIAKPLLHGSFTFGGVFALYAVAAGLPKRLLDPIEGTAVSVSDIGTADLVPILYWLAAAVAGAIVAFAAVIYAAVQIRACLKREHAAIVGTTLAASVVVAAWLAQERGSVMMSWPQSMTCATKAAPVPMITIATKPPVGGGFYCAAVIKPSWRMSASSQWFARIVWAKLWLNIVFQAAAVCLLGAMLFIAPASRADACRAKCAVNVPGIMLKLLVASGIVLSTITFTDIVFSNWPLAVVGEHKGKILTNVMAALIFYYAAISSLTLGTVIVVTRDVVERSLATFSREERAGWAGWLSALPRPEVVEAAAALSPVLTVIVSNPLFAELLKI